MQRLRESPTDNGILKILTNDGAELIWVFTSRRYDEPGRTPYVVGHAQDITEQVQTETHLRKLVAATERQTRELALLAEIRGSLTLEGDSWRLFARVVEPVHRLLGYARVHVSLADGDGFAVQHAAGDDNEPGQMANIDQDVAQAARDGKPVLRRWTTTDGDGLPHQMSVLSMPFMDGGEFAGALTVVRRGGEPIDEDDQQVLEAVADHIRNALIRTRLLRSARASERQYRAVIESISEVVFQTGADGRWSFLNPAWTRLTHYPLEDSRGSPAVSFVHPEDRPAVLRRVLRQIRSGAADYQDQFRYITLDGEVCWAEVDAGLHIRCDGSV